MPEWPKRLIPLAVKRLYWKLRCPRGRHRWRARLSATSHRALWTTTWKLRRVRQPIVAIGLVEHVGDIVATEPLARSLRQENPDALLVWVVRRPYRELVETNPHIDAVLPVACLTEWIHLGRSRTFDRVVDLHMRGRCCETCWLLHDRVDGRTDITAENYYDHGSLLQIYSRLAGLIPCDEAPRMYIPKSCRDSVDRLRLPEDYLVLHAASNQAERDWEPMKWRQLARRTAEGPGMPIVEVGLKSVIGPGGAAFCDLCGRLSLLETAEVIRRARLFVGIDSGPAHMANAVGTRGVILLGHYARWRRYMPYSGDYGSGANAEIIYGDGPASTIPVDQVYEAVRRSLAHRATLSPLPPVEIR